MKTVTDVIQAPYPDNDDKYFFVARAFIEGEIFPAMKNLKEYLNTNTAEITRPGGRQLEMELKW